MFWEGLTYEMWKNQGVNQVKKNVIWINIHSLITII